MAGHLLDRPTPVLASELDESETPGLSGKLNILILNTDLPVFPGRAGHEFLLTTGLARLARKVGLVSMAHTEEQQELAETLRAAGVHLYLWTPPGGPTPRSATPSPPASGPQGRRRTLRRAYDLLREWPIRPYESFLQDLQFRNLSGPLNRALQEERWDVVVVVQSSSAHWFNYLPRTAAQVLVFHDIRALLYERRAQTSTSIGERLANLIQSRLYYRQEGAIARSVDLAVTVSPDDEAFVRREYRPRNLLTIPIPVDTTYFSPQPVREVSGRIVFTGTMDHPPNVDAAGFFAHEVFPRVRAMVPDAEFWIVGRDPSPEVESLGAKPGVVVTGFVEDIRQHMASAAVTVVPLRYGSGMRNKILEAWSMRKCVVSTRIGAEGLRACDGENLILADTADDLAEAVVETLRHPALRQRIARKGPESAATHDPGRLSSAYFLALQSTVEERRERADPMRVAIDLRWMKPGQAGGIENLSRSFVKQLIQLDKVNRYLLMLPPQAAFDFDISRTPNVRRHVVDGPYQTLRQLAWMGERVLHNRLGADYWRSPDVESLLTAKSFGAEVALSVPGYIHPELHPLLNVLIVPDIQHEYFPGFFTPTEQEERRRLYTGSIERAHHICAISEFTRQTLIERLGVAPEKVTTTRLAADPIFELGSPARGKVSAVLEKYHLPRGQYILFPGNTWPHKNHVAAFEALRILRERHGLEPLLLCTGSTKSAQREIMESIDRNHLSGRVRFLGYCPEWEMPALYEGAAAVLMPSLFEGFGIPLVEAMWCGCPIACSGTTSLPEIAGEAAVYFDPRQPEQMAEQLRRVLEDSELRQRLVTAGYARAQQFSWFKFTTQVVSILREIRDGRKDC